MSVTLRLYDGAGAFLSMLPAVGSVEVQHVLNDEGSGMLSYLASGVGAAELIGLGDNLDLTLTDCMVGVHLDGKEIFRFLLEEDEDNEADPAGVARYLRVGGAGTLALLARGVVLPGDGIGAVPATHKFENATAGRIMLHLLGEMKRLGYLTQVETSFTATRDSAGQLWDTWIDVEYDAGRDLLTVVKDLANQGCCDTRMVGLRLDLFNPNTALGVDRPNIYVRRAHAASAPRRRSRRNLRTDYLVVGDEGVNTLRFDQDARDRYGRRIGFIGQGNTISADALYRVGDEALKENARPTSGYTVDLHLAAASCPQPYTDFQLGDQIRSDFAQFGGGGYSTMRVRSIATSFGEDGVTKCSLELNDRFTEAILDLQRKVDGIRHGKIGTTSRPPTEPNPGPNTVAPKPPTTVRTRGQLSYSPEGNATATMEVSWPPVLENDDDASSPIEDLEHYEVRYRLLDEQLPPEEQEPDTGGDDTGGEGTPDELVETFVENFARPNSQWVSNGWTQVGGDFSLVNEAATTSAGSTLLLRSYGRKDMRVRATLTASGGTPSVAAWADINRGIQSGYVAQYNPMSTTSNVQLIKNGVVVWARHFGPLNNRIGAGTHTMSLEIRNKVITVLIDNQEAMVWTDTGVQPTGTWAGAGTGGKAALAVEAVTMSEWRLGTPATPAPTPTPEPETPEEGEPTDAYTAAGTTTETSMLITGLPTGTRVQSEVRAVDTDGNSSEWLVAEVFLTPGDNAPPPPPAALELTPALGGVRARWSRTTSDGGSLPPDFREIEVFASTVGATFEPDPTTRIGIMQGTSEFFTGLPYDQLVWIRAVMVDRVGNRSEPSQAVAVTPRRLVSTELGVGQVLASNLANGSVGVDKLTVGVLSDSMLLNPNFEDLTNSGLPVAWNLLGTGDFLGATYAIDTLLPKSGSRVVRMRAAADRRAAVQTQSMYPVSAGEWYFAAAWLRGSAGSGGTHIVWYDTDRNVLEVSSGLGVMLSATWQQSLALKKAPDSAAFVRVEVRSDQSAAGVDVWVDSADLRKATGRAQILDASIGAAQIEDLAVQRAKIALAAVGDAQVESMSVSKLTAGALTAEYVTVTGMLTSQTPVTSLPDAAEVPPPNRWELDSNSLRAYNASDEQTFRLGSDGTITMKGGVLSQGEIEAAEITGGTITGAVVRTADETKQRIEMSSATGPRIHFYGATSNDSDPTVTPAYIEVADHTNAAGYTGVALRMLTPGSDSRLPAQVRLDGDAAMMVFGPEPTGPWVPARVLIGYHYPAVMTYRETKVSTKWIVTPNTPGYIAPYNHRIVNNYPKNAWPSTKQWPDIPVPNAPDYVMRAYNYRRETAIPVYGNTTPPPVGGYSYVKVMESSIEMRGNVVGTGSIRASGGLFDGANRAYSASNPPPLPTYRNRDIYGSYLAAGPLFSREFGNWNDYVMYHPSTAAGAGLGFHSHASPLIAYSHEFSTGSPVITARPDGAVVVARQVIANGVTLSSSQQHKTNIEPSTGGLAQLRQLQPVCYDRVNDANGKPMRQPDTETGLIAEQVALVAPEVSPDGKTVDVMALVTLLVKSLQELADRVDALPGQPVGPPK